MQWFYDTSTQFHMWDTTHIFTIITIISLYVVVYLTRHTLRRYRHFIRMTVGITLLVSRVSLDVWYISTGTWNVHTALPLELCSIASLACAIMLLTKNRFLFEAFYFIGIAGAIQAIVTPELFFGFPQFRFLQFFIDHTFLILAPLIMIWLYDYTITVQSLMKAFVTINVIAAIVFVINIFLDANYMFLMHKPASASLLDVLGPYPYYLLSLEAIALAVFILLYLPFVRKQRG